MSQQRGAKQVNRAEIVDRNFINTVERTEIDQADPALLDGAGISREDFLELFTSQIASRQLDLMARELRLQNRVFYTIGSSGHEGNAMVGRAMRRTDPAFLHYRSGGFMMERLRQVPGVDPVYDTALSFAASANDPASGGRHKVWGSKEGWVLPQTSTIASHLPKALGAALAIEHARRIGYQLPIPYDAIALCSFGDASLNHSTAQGAINAVAWAAYQGLSVPLVMLCEDNGIGISVKSPSGWVAASMSNRAGIRYVYVDGLDLAASWRSVCLAIDECRRTRKPLFLHMRTVRLMGHAGTDFEIDYRTEAELEACEAIDPLLRSADLALRSGAMQRQQIVDLYEQQRARCFEAADRADQTPKLQDLAQVAAPLAPLDIANICRTAKSCADPDTRLAHFGSERQLPENQPPRHLAININRALHDIMLQYTHSVLFGEDVAKKGGVYTITRELNRKLGNKRVFNTLLDEQTILGLAQGYGTFGMLPIPEIQYLAYFHNACDQIRGEACSLQFFSNGQFANPMLLRIAGLGYQKGFGGHFHNDNSFTALRDIPGLILGCPSRGDDAVLMLRTLAATAQVSGRVCAFLEPIALYMTKDLYSEGDGEWNFAYPAPGQCLEHGEPRIYSPEHKNGQLLIVTFGNGVPMSLRAARQLRDQRGTSVTVMDLRWLMPLNEDAIAELAATHTHVLVVDEGRYSGGISEAIVSSLAQRLPRGPLMSRVVGADCYTPLGAAAGMVLPDEDQIVSAALQLLESSDDPVLNRARGRRSEERA